MNEELEKIWENFGKKEYVRIDKKKFLEDLNTQLKSFEKTIKKRDLRESIAAVVVILLFGAGAFIFTDILSKAGMILGVLYGGLVIFMFKRVKKHKPENNTLPIRDYLTEYLKYLKKERSLLTNVIYWYLLPPFIACFLFFVGQNIGFIMLIVNSSIIFCLYVFIYILNRKGVKKTFNPLIKETEKAIESLTEQ